MINNHSQRSHQLASGDVIVLSTGTDADGQPCVTVSCACAGPHVVTLTLTFPMRSIQAASHFVATADENVFVRARARLDAELQMVALFEKGLSRKRV